MTSIPWWLYMLVALTLFGAYALSFVFSGGMWNDKRRVIFRRILVFGATTVGLLATILQLQANALQLQASTTQLRASAAQHRFEVEHRRREAAFRYIDRWENSEAFFAGMRELRDFARSKEPAQVDTYLRASTQRMLAWSRVSNFFEGVGLAVKTGFADETPLCEYFGAWDAAGPATSYFGALKPWIDYQRQGSSNQRSMFEHYEWLYERWKNGCGRLPPYTWATPG